MRRNDGCFEFGRRIYVDDQGIFVDLGLLTQRCVMLGGIISPFFAELGATHYEELDFFLDLFAIQRGVCKCAERQYKGPWEIGESASHIERCCMDGRPLAGPSFWRHYGRDLVTAARRFHDVRIQAC